MILWRVIFAILSAVGMAIIYGLKVNLSVAIVAMVNITSSHHVGDHDNTTDVCFNPEAKEEETKSDMKLLDWGDTEIGIALGSYFYGYFVTQIPGGRLAELYSAKWIFLIAVIINGGAAILSPILAKQGFAYFVAMRILQGIGGGVTFPAMNVLIGQWAPKSELSSITTVVFGGTAIGTVISLPTAGLIASNPDLGWEGVFYIHGGLSFIWCILWVLLVSDSPSTHSYISDEEKAVIAEGKTNQISTKKGFKVPWISIITSIPFWAIIVAHTCNNFGWYMLLVELPSFLSFGLGFDIKENALLSSLPFLANWLVSLGYSRLLDVLMSKNKISRKNGRKISQLIASLIPAICLVGCCMAGCDRTGVVILMVIATTSMGTMFSGVFSNHNDIAPNFGGLLMGITNMAATLPGFIVPAMVGAMTHGQVGLTPWHQIFYLTAGIFAIEALVFGFFAEAEEQSWNKIPDETSVEMESKEKLNEPDEKEVESQN